MFLTRHFPLAFSVFVPFPLIVCGAGFFSMLPPPPPQPFSLSPFPPIFDKGRVEETFSFGVTYFCNVALLPPGVSGKLFFFF